MNKIFYVIMLLGLVSFSACTTKDLDPTLAQEKELEGNITTTEDLLGILKGGLNRMTNSTYYGRDFIINNVVRTDNTFANGTSGRFTTQDQYTYNASSGLGCWTEAYRVISSANLIIGVDLETINGDKEEITHIQGQAYAMRALAHFDLMRNYGQQYVGGTLGVPIISVFKGDEESPSRNTVDEVKAIIYTDLDLAYSKMSVNYFDDSKEFFSKMTAKALESNVALYFGDWDRCVSASEAVINSGLYSIIPATDYVNSFAVDGSANSIFELAFSETDNQGINGLGYIYRGTSYGDIECYAALPSIFEAGDVRADIVDFEAATGLLRNMFKYPELNGYDNVNVIRYEQIILNYAEALFETGGDALTQVNMLRAQRGVPAFTSVTKDDILAERRKELMFEGYYFDDLVRTGKDVQKPTFVIPGGDYRLAFPIPLVEIDANSNIQQNSGY